MTDRHPATVGHATPADDSCSVLWDVDGTSAYGTAAAAKFFVVVEQSGPWGRVVARESHLPDGLGVELDARAAALGGRFMLIRHAGGHADHDGLHRVLLAHAGADPRSAWLLAGDVTDPRALLSLDWTALSTGDRELARRSLPGAHEIEPALLICTNGRRDVCCAVRGRPLAAAAAELAPDRVWEVSHTGGHRFAPTAVLLPWGEYLARLDIDAVRSILTASSSGQLPRTLLGPQHDRGRSGLPGPAQAAESFVRHLIGETDLNALATGLGQETPDGHRVPVAHVDGRRWVARVSRLPTGQHRPESCRKSPVDVFEYAVAVGHPERD